MYQAKDIMQTNLITVSTDTSVLQVIKILADNGITGLPVVDDQMRLLGLVSEKDVLAIACHVMNDAFDKIRDNKTATDIMTTDVTFFRPDDSLADVGQCFMNNSFRRVPVVADGILVGLISRKDVIIHAFDKVQETAETCSADA